MTEEHNRSIKWRVFDENAPKIVGSPLLVCGNGHNTAEPAWGIIWWEDRWVTHVNRHGGGFDRVPVQEALDLTPKFYVSLVDDFEHILGYREGGKLKPLPARAS